MRLIANLAVVAITAILSYCPLWAESIEVRSSHIVATPPEAIYNPTDEFIFPTVIETSHIQNPLGRYYLYYAPHDAPGGISLAYSDNIAGPFTEYAQNPILSNKHQNRFNVSHVSSPHVRWMPQYNKFFMYFHGENTTTRWAYSTDGLNWNVALDNVAVTAAKFGPAYTETSYAKVFEYGIEGKDNRYIMLLMTLRAGKERRIGLAVSKDGKKFTPVKGEFLVPQQGDGPQMSGPFFFQRNGRNFIAYHSSSGKVSHVAVNKRFDLIKPLGTLYSPSADFPELGKAADFFLIFAENKWNMFTTVGKRLEQSINYSEVNFQ